MGDLPAELTSFVGRTRDAEDTRNLILHGAERLVTLIGIGGCGKTRLALHVAANLRGSFRDGVYLVELAPVSDSRLVVQATLAAFGVAESSLAPIETLTATLAGRELLLVLDNCEHLLDACARIVEHLLTACPTMRILATSREPLRVPGERARRVHPLAVPDLAEPHPLSDLARYPSVQLFVERARAAAPMFQLSPENAEAVARICSRLGGIPLAVELAAAHARDLSAEEILERLDQPFRILADDRRNAPTRQQTMRAALDWSYDLLDDLERAVFRRLAGFSGGCALEMAEAVCAGGVARDAVDASEILDVLTRLVNKSLVLADGEPGAPRFHLLEPVRQYAEEWLRATGEHDWVRAHHLESCLDLAERAASGMRGPAQLTFIALLEQDQGNLRQALLWAEEQNDGEASLRLATALATFWERRSHLSEARRWFDSALERSRSQPVAPVLRARALLAAGRLAHAHGRYDDAVTLEEQARRYLVALDDRGGVAAALANLGLTRRLQRRLDESTRLLEQGLALSREVGERSVTAFALLNLGITWRIRGEVARSRPLLAEGLARYRELGDLWGVSTTLAMLGFTELEGRDFSNAAQHLAEGLSGHHALRDHFFMIADLLGLAQVLIDQARATDAARLLGAAHRLGKTSTDLLLYLGRAGYDSLLSNVGLNLAADELSTAWEAGYAMSLDAVKAFALACATPPAQPADPSASSDPSDAANGLLTTREWEVARLIADGWRANRQIAERLTISTGTAGVHVQNILNKLGLHSRWQIVDWVGRHRKGIA
ncbi:MAG TPA: LuxR C-terminal-related transcriptional regulator [Chloroflexota bacterium]|nr:LuxR C-terminal-related transcriptional regulator [Chloroflexota bacterium]